MRDGIVIDTDDPDIFAERAAGLADILMAGRNKIKTGYGAKYHRGVLDLILRQLCGDMYYVHYLNTLEARVDMGRQKRLKIKDAKL